jgi:nitrate/TMAO reductase-like tetraheme cytochrome c subunit
MTRQEIRRWVFDVSAWIVGLATAAILVAEADAGVRTVPPATNAAWHAECGSCHVAYPPQLLAAQSWRTIMQDLDRHFGVDASVDAPVAASIGAFLQANAGREGSKRIDPSALRITETPWFRHEHSEIAAAVWRRTDVRGPANCGACHREADRGDFGERSVRVPR